LLTVQNHSGSTIKRGHKLQRNRLRVVKEGSKIKSEKTAEHLKWVNMLTSNLKAISTFYLPVVFPKYRKWYFRSPVQSVPQQAFSSAHNHKNVGLLYFFE